MRAEAETLLLFIFFLLQKYGAEFTWRTSLVCPPYEVCSYGPYDLGLLSSRTRSWNYTHNGDRY